MVQKCPKMDENWYLKISFFFLFLFDYVLFGGNVFS